MIAIFQTVMKIALLVNGKEKNLMMINVNAFLVNILNQMAVVKNATILGDNFLLVFNY